MTLGVYGFNPGLRQPLRHLLHRGAVLANCDHKDAGVSLRKATAAAPLIAPLLAGPQFMANAEIEMLEEKAMAMKPQLRTVLLAACLTLAITSGSALPTKSRSLPGNIGPSQPNR